jgi:hypothetical protein
MATFCSYLIASAHPYNLVFCVFTSIKGNDGIDGRNKIKASIRQFSSYQYAVFCIVKVEDCRHSLLRTQFSEVIGSVDVQLSLQG